MSSTVRLTLLVMGAVALTLILAAAISDAMDGGNSLPSLNHQVAIHATGGDTPQPGLDTATPEPPSAVAPAPEPTIDVEQDPPEQQPAGDRRRGRDGGDGDTGDGDGHGG